ncbi:MULTISPECIES: acyl-CoA thioesterase [Thiorhodovibrio]|uniref:acyl-CoA thioesterase n=1 Tax=Thiorhodovibrio TaxID=61593 RepID=UPI0019138A2C|nr:MULTISPECIES: thioesterase family protein [Thiorhodovibrio]MBK5968340.1 hypothetical protein [Thiorhodovibrio winogradskyi]WPL13211.1 1,4-dihydroxy-2-naphthoyl-CoA hydrolase [Thiorhodovibrio litoralis]
MPASRDNPTTPLGASETSKATHFTQGQSPALFEYSFRIALHDVDAAGLIFFGNLFRHLHDAYECWMETLGFPIDALIRQGEILLPLIHAEADYRAPMRHGARIRIQLGLDQLAATRFTLTYRCLNQDNTLAATALTRHCCIDPERHKPTPIPGNLAKALVSGVLVSGVNEGA